MSSETSSTQSSAQSSAMPRIPAAETGTSVRETGNVSYTGIVEPAGISIYMQGTHRLLLRDGRFLLLESAAVPLEDYSGNTVEVFGATRPTVEGGGIIMRVERVEVLEEEPEEAEKKEEEIGGAEASEKSEENEDGEKDSVRATNTLTQSSSSSSRSSRTSSTVAISSESSEAEIREAPVMNAELAARAAAMTKEDVNSGRWTQQYCSSHIGFCIPVHKNWWYKSFGTTTTYLWHVEVSSEPVEELGGGPLSVNLVTGSVNARKAIDGQVRVQGDLVIGYREWTENRHFEVSAPATLESSVRFMTENLRTFAP